jgi:oligopeptide transport system substrate-binding protein
MGQMRTLVNVACRVAEIGLPAGPWPARRRGLVAASALLAGLIAVAGPALAQSEPTLRVAIQADPTTLDPAMTDDPTGTAIVQNIYTPLVEVDERGQVKPLAAKSWTVSADRRVFRFVLADKLQFHGGQKATATDVKYSLDRLASPKTNSPNAKLLLTSVEGFEDLQAGKATELRGVRVVSPTEVEIRVDRPEGDFLVRLAHPAAAIVSKDAIEQGGESWATTHPNGTGAYKLVEWALRRRIVLAANPAYFGGSPRVAKIVLEIVPDPTIGVQKYEAGELDLVQVPGPEYTRLKADPKYAPELVEYNRAVTVFFALNQTAYPPFKDIRVRRAVAMAVNRPQLARAAFQGLYEPASGILPPGFPGFAGPLPAVPFDPAKAKQLLAEAGFPDGKGLPPLVLGPNPRGFGPKLAAEVVANMLGEHLGIQAQVQVLDIAKWRADLRKKDVFAAVTGWTADVADPNDYLYALFESKAPFAYFSGYVNPAYDQMLAAANREGSRDAALRKLREVERFLVVEDLGVVPIYHVREVILRKPYVRDLQFTPYGLGFLEHFRSVALVR